MKFHGLLMIIFVCGTVFGEEKVSEPEYAQRGWSTVALGGILPTAEQLKQMHQSSYILRSVNNKLEKVEVEKISLPLDPCGHTQRLGLFVGPDKAIYATQCSLMSKSSDGGKTWTHLRRKVDKNEMPNDHFMNFRVLPDGTWIQARDIKKQGIVFYVSNDEGQVWTQVTRINKQFNNSRLLIGDMEVFPNGDLGVPLTNVIFKDKKSENDIVPWESVKSLFCLSTDGGRSFSNTRIIGEWGHEINVSKLSSGRLLAVIRYQRPLLPTDPSNIFVLTGSKRFNQPFPYKHLFLADSTDNGKSWSPLRQLTTESGQCHGQAVGLANGRVVVSYDHRYPRVMAGARAVVSDDEGQTWRDEVYYLSNGMVGGFARTITLDGIEMITLTGTSDLVNYDSSIGASYFSLIRWRLAN